MERIDLHTHSTYSDGTLTPRELINRAADMELKAMALTDHDTVAGLKEAADAARNTGVELVNGIEISVMYNNREIHMLGLFIDPNYEPLLAELKNLEAMRIKRNEELTARLQQLGVDVSEILAASGYKMVSRIHYARAIVELGICDTMEQAFRQYFAPGRPAYILREAIDAEYAIKLIHSASGKAVLAHPMLYRMERPQISHMAESLKDSGLDGIEAIYSRNSTADDIFLLGLAKKYRLKVTGGSDFHGENKPDIEIGIGCGNLFVPYTLLAELQ